MASPLSDIVDLVTRLQESARRGDWASAGELAALLPQQRLPATPEELGEYLLCMKEALVAAKASRAHTAACLVRLNAASRFNNARSDFAPRRQEFGEVADS